MNNERVDDIVKFSHQDIIELVQGEIDSVIADPALREVVGSDALAPVTASHLTLAVRGHLLVLLALHLVKQPGPENLQGLGLVLVL